MLDDNALGHERISYLSERATPRQDGLRPVAARPEERLPRPQRVLVGEGGWERIGSVRRGERGQMDVIRRGAVGREEDAVEQIQLSLRRVSYLTGDGRATCLGQEVL